MPASHRARAAVRAAGVAVVGALLAAACSAPPPPPLDRGTAPDGPVAATMARLVDGWRSPSGQAALPAGRYLLTSEDTAGSASAVALVYTGDSRESWVLEARGGHADDLTIAAAARRRWQSATDLGPWAIPLIGTGPRFLVADGTELSVRTAGAGGFEPVPEPEDEDVPLPACAAAVVRLADTAAARPAVRHELWTGGVPGATGTPLLDVTAGGEAGALALLDALRGVDLCAAGQPGGLLDQVVEQAAARATGRPEDVFWVQGAAPLVAADMAVDGRAGRLTVIGWEAGGSGALITSAVWRPQSGAAVLSPPVRAAELAAMRLQVPAGPVDVLLELPGLGAVRTVRGAAVQHDGWHPAPGGSGAAHRVIVYRSAATPVLELAGADGVREQVVGAP